MRSRTRSGSRAGSRPRTRTEPESGAWKPSQISMVVVLPAPLGPSSAVISPCPAVMEKPSTAVVAP